MLYYCLLFEHGLASKWIMLYLVLNLASDIRYPKSDKFFIPYIPNLTFLSSNGCGTLLVQHWWLFCWNILSMNWSCIHIKLAVSWSNTYVLYAVGIHMGSMEYCSRIFFFMFNSWIDTASLIIVFNECWQKTCYIHIFKLFSLFAWTEHQLYIWILRVLHFNKIYNLNLINTHPTFQKTLFWPSPHCQKSYSVEKFYSGHSPCAAEKTWISPLVTVLCDYNRYRAQRMLC